MVDGKFGLGKTLKKVLSSSPLLPFGLFQWLICLWGEVFWMIGTTFFLQMSDVQQLWAAEKRANVLERS